MEKCGLLVRGCGDRIRVGRMKKPIVLLGATGSPKIIAQMKELGWGMMFCETNPKLAYKGMPFALDNGAFMAWKSNKKWNPVPFLRRVQSMQDRSLSPLFVVAPDLPTKGETSLLFSVLHHGACPSPVALAVQDGQTFQGVKKVMDQFDYIFLGGSDAFKLRGRDWCKFSHDHGKKFHFARASTIERLEYAIDIGADSLDTTFPLWTKERLKLYKEVWEHGHPNIRFPFAERDWE